MSQRIMTTVAFAIIQHDHAQQELAKAKALTTPNRDEMVKSWEAHHDYTLQELTKAGVTTSDTLAITPQDIEEDVHIQLWRETDANELTLLKLLPSVAARQVLHQYAVQTDYDNQPYLSTFFGDTTLPSETGIAFRRLQERVKLMGNLKPVHLLAALSSSLRNDGENDIEGITMQSQRRALLYDKNKQIYFSDTRCHRQGGSSVRFRGLLQQIEEGTTGAVNDTEGVAMPASPLGSHVIDMRGLPPTLENIMDRQGDIIRLFGGVTTLLMSPAMRQDMEKPLLNDRRHPTPHSTEPYLVGSLVGGFQTAGKVCWFDTDNVLSPEYCFGKYRTDLAEGAPTGRPVVTGAVTSATPTEWDSSSAGTWFWLVTETKDEKQSLGARWPSSGGQAVVAGNIVTLTCTASSAAADSFRVHRGNYLATANADTDAWFIFEVAHTAAGAAQTIVDRNYWRPGLNVVFGLSLYSGSSTALHSVGANGMLNGYDHAKANSGEFFKMKNTDSRNTIAMVHLGPQMGQMDMARLVPTTQRPLLYSPCTPVVYVPRKNFVLKNCGRLT